MPRGFRRRTPASPRPADLLPPALPTIRPDSAFCRPGTLFDQFVVTRYWGEERHARRGGRRPKGIPTSFRQFDWLVGWLHGWGSVSSPPEKVFANPKILLPLLDCLKLNFGSRFHPKATLVVGGADVKLSTCDEALLSELRFRFPGGIYWEAMDVNRDGVKVMPIGLLEAYLRGNERAIVKLSRTASSQNRQMKALAAWGAWFPELDRLIPDRQRARAFAATSSLVLEANFSTKRYFQELTRHEFMLCPEGNGVQSPKVYEALMMGCIPICTESPAYMGLKSNGWPIVIVGHWGEVTFEKLEQWQKEIRPLVSQFQQSMKTHAAWWKRVETLDG